MTKATILCIDDNMTNLDFLTRLLSKSGYNVIGTQNPAEGIELARTHHPDIVLLDIQMPEMSGYDVVRVLRTEVMDQHSIIIAVTANAMPGDKRICLQSGFTDYITKPIFRLELFRMLDKYINRRAATS